MLVMKLGKLALFAAFACAFLLLGCTESGEGRLPIPPKPVQETPQIVQPANNTQNVSNSSEYITPSIPAKINCNVSVSPSQIYAGQKTNILFNVYSDGNTRFTFNCEDESMLISTGGLINGNRYCLFTKPGEAQVSILADGQICASANLTVLESGYVDRKCFIDANSIQRKINVTSFYSATVWFRDFSQNTTLDWWCDKKQMGVGVNGTQGAALVYCGFNTVPDNDEIPVSIENVPCGRIATRLFYPTEPVS